MFIALSNVEPALCRSAMCQAANLNLQIRRATRNAAGWRDTWYRCEAPGQSRTTTRYFVLPK